MLQERIEAIHTISDQTDGVPRIVAELLYTHQWIVNHKRCAQLMRVNGVVNDVFSREVAGWSH